MSQEGYSGQTVVISFFLGTIAGAAAVLLLVAAALAAAVWLYNRLVRLRNTVSSSWSDIGVLLKKRYDLVDNLVATVKGYASHERTTLTSVTEARTRAANAASPEEKSRAEAAFGRVLGSFFAVAENYPDLKANANFLDFQQQLRTLEDQIEHARRYYNAVVRDYNTLTESFPANLIAGSFGFARSEFFESPAPGETAAPRVSFKD
jgi:LemA protein